MPVSDPSPSPPQPRRWIPRAILAAAALLAILAFAVAFLWFPRGPGPKEEFESALAELKSRGFAVTTDHLWTPCPDEDNAWLEWGALFGFNNPPSSSPSSTATTSSIVSISTHPSAPVLISRPVASRSAPPNPRLVPPEDLLLSLAQSPASLTPADKDRLRDYFSATSATLAAFESLASKSRLVDPDNRNRPLHAWNAPKLAGVSKPFRTQLHARALMAIEDADRDTAIHLDLVALRFSRLPGTDPTSIGFMLGVVLRSMTLDQLEQTLRAFPIPEDQCQALFGTLDPSEIKDQAIRGIDRERLWCLELCQAYFNGDAAPTLGTLPAPLQSLDDFFFRRSLATDAAMIQRRCADILTSARKPYWEGRFTRKTIQKEIDGLSDYHKAAKIFLLPRGVLENAARLEARSTVLRIALASRIHAARTGTPPAALDALVPEFFPSIPLDPFTGKPFHYRLTPDGGFLVSSVGPNGLDETTTASLALAASLATADAATTPPARTNAPTTRRKTPPPAATGDDIYYEEKPYGLSPTNNE